MTFCPNCGAAVEGRFCGKCGTAVTPASTGQTSAPPPGGGPQYSSGPPPNPPQQQYTPPPAAGAGMQENVASALCYLVGLITGILFLVLEPHNRNRNVRFHAFQSIFLNVAWIVLIIVTNIIAVALPWSLYVVVSMLYLVLFLGVFVLWLYLMISAYQGKRVKLPVIGDIAEKQA
jgi:uncharacterized membrane protein